MRFIIPRLILGLFVALSFTARPTSAQCFGPDGFFVPGVCCQIVTPNLPTFVQGVLPSEYACLRDCSPELIESLNIQIGNPIPLFCDTYVIGVSVAGTTVVPMVPTFMIAKYSRTWTEFDTAGNAVRQVWRFLINADINYVITSTSTTPCPIPPSHGLGTSPDPTHFIGSLDYVQPCGVSPLPPARPGAINLTHFCGQIAHAPFSARPEPAATAHFDRSYHFVGPTPFVWGPAPTPTGAVFGAQRSTLLDLPAVDMTCYNENPIVQGQVTDVMQNCLCVPQPGATGVGPPIWHHQDIFFTYVCSVPGSPPFSFMPFPFAPWLPTGIACMNLGTHGGPAGAYPSGESVSVYVGFAGAPDPCQPWFPFHVVHGVGTTGGLPSVPLSPSPVLPGMPVNGFIDLTNSLLFDPSSPDLVSIGIGSIYFSNQVWQLNVF